MGKVIEQFGIRKTRFWNREHSTSKIRLGPDLPITILASSFVNMPHPKA
jgi:hypothetical protein